MAIYLFRKNNFVWQHHFYQCSYNIWSVVGKWLPWVQLLFRLLGISRILLRNEYWLIIQCTLIYSNDRFISEIYLKLAIEACWYLVYQWEHETHDGIRRQFRDSSYTAWMNLHLKLQKLNIKTDVSSYNFHKISDDDTINSIH